ncbi:carbonic anhydrase [Candidatus Pelagibacter bacterium]|jgi:carbonic anhydrase|nr:carbonic anhydrase [Candidatus Pelagibacter bacterium]MDB2655097.1 carbonic anhydrase [Candidatus Pelagibacter bacterium]MDC0352159.1 carbonic anhydrase [Candidatus Pelagibacter sp.]
MKSKYKAMVLSCMDPRFQNLVHNFLKKKKLTGKYSAFTIAGAAVGVTHSKFKKWHNTFYDNLATSIQLHKIEKLIIINHKDCGAAKIANGKKEFNPENEKNIHKNSFNKLKKEIKKRFPKLKVELNLIALDSKVIKF